MLESAVSAARELSLNVHVGNIFTADLFYPPDTEMFDVIEKYNILGVEYNILGVEMETAGIYAAAVVSVNAGESTSNS